VTVEAQALYRHKKFIGASLMASLAELGSVRAVLNILLFFCFICIDRGTGADTLIPVGRWRSFIGVGHAVKERSEHLVARSRFASEKHGRAHENHKYRYYRSLLHSVNSKK
jgi:hypothetical protein